MPSPFPGMNPYFESPALWEDFHQSLAAEIRDQLVPKLRPKYYAALTPRVTYEEVLIQAKAQDAKPDVGVWRQRTLVIALAMICASIIRSRHPNPIFQMRMRTGFGILLPLSHRRRLQ